MNKEFINYFYNSIRKVNRCPYCNALATIHCAHGEFTSNTYWWVNCTHCNAETTELYQTKEDAIFGWNEKEISYYAPLYVC